ncbi:sodium ion-translocating decarboxylase subunit beta [Klebsiella grimontii]
MDIFIKLFSGIGTFFIEDPTIAIARILLIILGFVLAWMGFRRTLEPLIMVPMGLGMIAVNAGVLFLAGGQTGTLILDPMISDPTELVNIMQINFLQPVYNLTFSNGLIACIVFFGIGAMSDISFILLRPWASIIVALFAEAGTFAALLLVAEGRCYLSSYLTGESPNTVGACSPARFVRWQQTPQGLESRLNEVLIDRYRDGENAGYPTLCKGRYLVDGERYHALEEPTSLNTLELLPELMAANIASVKIEGRQRSPAYVTQVAKVWRQAIDRCKADPQNFVPQSAWMETLGSMSEGTQTTLGAYHRKWQ